MKQSWLELFGKLFCCIASQYSAREDRQSSCRLISIALPKALGRLRRESRILVSFAFTLHLEHQDVVYEVPVVIFNQK